MTRLRYRQTENSVLVSTNPVLIGTDTVSVELNVTTLTVTLVNTFDGSVRFTTQVESEKQLKTTAKTALQNLGVQFTPETRRRTKKTETNETVAA